MKFLSRPRQGLLGAALLLIVVLTSCGAPLAGESWPGISSDGKFVYVAWKNHILRVDPSSQSKSASRSIDWSAALADNVHMYAPPTIGSDGSLYEGGWDHKIYAFSQNTGQNLWTTPAFTDKVVSGGLVSGSTVYVGMGDKGIVALDKTNGSQKWLFSNTKYGVWAAPILVDNTLYFGSLDHFLYALDPEKGTLKWSLDLGGAVSNTLLYANGILYTGTFANEFLSISVESHKVVNRYATRGWVWGTPVMAGSTLYFGDLDGWVYALDANSFTLKWEKNDPDHPGAIRGRVAIAHTADHDMVITGGESKYLHAYDLTSGNLLWTSAIQADDQILSDLIVIGNDVIFTTVNEGDLLGAFDIETGQKSWSVSLTNELNRLQTATNPPITYSPPQLTPTGAATGAASGTGTTGSTATAAPAATSSQ